jgi:hypothetical protein
MADFREARSLDDYIDVAQRVADFREKYPDGRLAPWDRDEPYKIVQAQGFEKNGDVITQTFIVVVAAAYRSPDDPAPGVGMAWEIFPGRTPYTRGSELQNAETSAWGRAIIAVGASDSKRGIASREEMRNRQAERDDGLPQNADGSLSRSRTSDEEKQAAGVMTAAQLKEHSALKKPPPNTQPVERLSTTVDEENPWNQPPTAVRAKPAGWALHEAFHNIGVDDRKERLAQCSEIVGRPISTSGELEPMEVGAILEVLQRRLAAS